MNEATYTVGPDDLVAAYRLNFLKSFSIRQWLFAFIGGAVGMAFLILVSDGVIDPESYLLALGSIWGIVVAICIVGWLMIPMQARRIWSQAQKFWTGHRVKWDADQIHFKSERGESHVRWSDYYRWAANDKSLLLYQDSRLFYPLPLQSFPAGAAETIFGYLRAAGVQER